MSESVCVVCAHGRMDVGTLLAQSQGCYCPNDAARFTELHIRTAVQVCMADSVLGWSRFFPPVLWWCPPTCTSAVTSTSTTSTARMGASTPICLRTTTPSWPMCCSLQSLGAGKLQDTDFHGHTAWGSCNEMLCDRTQALGPELYMVLLCDALHTIKPFPPSIQNCTRMSFVAHIITFQEDHLELCTCYTPV